MMKVFRNRSIALLLAFVMIFSFSLFSAFAETNGDGGDNGVKAIKVEGYGANIKDPYHPKALIDWLEDEYDIDITTYYIKAGNNIYDSEGNLINDPTNDPIIGDYIDNQAFNKNLFDTVRYNQVTLGDITIGGTILPAGISHVLFLGTDKPVPPPKGTLRITKEVISDNTEAGPFAVTIEEYDPNGSQNGAVLTDSINLGGPITEGDTDFQLDPGTYKVRESEDSGANSVEYVPSPPSNNGEPDYVIVQIKSNGLTYLTIKNTFDSPVQDDNLNIHKDIAGFFDGDGPFKVKVMRIPSIRSSDMDSLSSKSELTSMLTWEKEYDIKEGDNFFTLDPGTYILWETDSQGGVPSYSGDGKVYKYLNMHFIKFTIDDDLTTINVLNTFPELEVDIEVIKTIGGSMENPGVPHEGIEFSLSPVVPVPVALTENGSLVFPLFRTTDSDGKLVFENIPSGEYTLSETLPNDFTTEFDGTIVVDSDRDQTIYVINNMMETTREPFVYNGSTIKGYKYNELEEGLEGWTIELRKEEGNNGPVPASNSFPMTTTTDANGYYEFTGLDPGTYIVSEVLKPGWDNIDPIEQTVVIGNERHGLGTQNFVNDDDLIAALHNDQLAFTAEGRIGDVGQDRGNQTHEINIHIPPSNSTVDEDSWVWKNNGVPMNFEINFDAATDTVVYTVKDNGNSESLSYVIPDGYTFSDIMVRTRATKANSGIMINDLTLDGSSIGGRSVAVGDSSGRDILWISGQELMDGFTLKGQSTMYWDTSVNVKDRPKNSELAYQIKFGVVPVEEEHTVNFMNEQVPNVIIEKEVSGTPTGTGNFEVSFERIFLERSPSNDVSLLELVSWDLLDQPIQVGTNEFNLKPGAYYRLWESRTRGASSVQYFGEDIEDMDVPGGESGVVIRVPKDGSISVTIRNTFRTPPTVRRGSVTVEYVEIDDDFNEISVLQATSNVVTNAIVGTAYNTTQLSFPGYQFVRVDPNEAAASGNVTVATKNVVYQYIQIEDVTPETGSVTVEYVEVNDEGEVISVLQEEAFVAENELVGTPYDTVELAFEGFDFLQVDPDEAPASGNVTVATQNVVYQYIRIDDVTPETGSVTVEYVEVNDEGEVISVLQEKAFVAENEVVGTPYDTMELAFEGFDFLQVDPDGALASGAVTTEEQHVVYQYIRVIEQIDDLDPPEGPVDETPVDDTPILDEEVPLGDGQLPRTGQHHAAVFYLIGLMIISLGLGFKRYAFTGK